MLVRFIGGHWAGLIRTVPHPPPDSFYVLVPQVVEWTAWQIESPTSIMEQRVETYHLLRTAYGEWVYVYGSTSLVSTPPTPPAGQYNNDGTPSQMTQNQSTFTRDTRTSKPDLPDWLGDFASSLKSEKEQAHADEDSNHPH